MPKPSDPALWATDTSFVAVGEDWDGEDTKVEPSVERQAEGWEPETFPPAEEFNWWMNLVGLWTEYIDDGVFEGPIEIDGDLEVGGDAHFSSSIVGDSSLVVPEIFATTAFHHGDMVLSIPGNQGIAVNDISSAPSSAVIYPFGGYSSIRTDGAVNLVYGVPLRVGDRVKSVSLRIKGNGTVNISNFDVNYLDSSTGAAQSIGATSASGVTASYQTLTLNVTDHTMAASEHLIVVLRVNGASLDVFGVDVTYDRP